MKEIRMPKRIAKAMILTALSMVLLLGLSVTSFAADDEDIPKEGVIYTLNYPDGTTITDNEDGEPLTYQDVTEALKKDNWILLGSGFRSDADGEAVLPSAWTEGTIRIVETKVPDGYSRGKESEKIADLEEGSVEFVNPREKSPTTGDSMDMLPLGILLVTSVMAMAILIRRRCTSVIDIDGTAGSESRNKTMILLFVVAAGLLTATSVYAADGFTINKVDDQGDPVKGAVFDVYGKPTVTYEKIADKTIDITLTKTWNDDNDKDGVRPDTEAFKDIVELSYTTSESTEDIIITDPAPKVTDNGNNTYTVTWEDVPMYEEDGTERSFGVGESELDGYEMGEITGDVQKGYKVTNTHKSVTINVAMDYMVYTGGAWANVMKGAQTVTVSGNGMDTATLSFTAADKGPKSVTLPGAGSYTVEMQGITQNDLKPEADLAALSDSSVGNPMPLIIDTVSATLTVDENGNCTVGDKTFTSFAFGQNTKSGDGEFIYGDIAALKDSYEGTGADIMLETLNPHSDKADAAASGNTVTLTTVMSHGWEVDDTEREQ